jgi:hypothetical protein
MTSLDRSDQLICMLENRRITLCMVQANSNCALQPRLRGKRETPQARKSASQDASRMLVECSFISYSSQTSPQLIKSCRYRHERILIEFTKPC